MKKLIVFYSRTGTTRKVAKVLAEKLSADSEEIRDTVNRNGVKGYLFSGRDAMKKKLTKLEPLTKNIHDYDLVIIGTPIWAFNMSAPIRTFLAEQRNEFNDVAFFCTMGGSGNEKAFKEMTEVSGKEPLSTMALTTKEVIKDEFAGKVDNFIEPLK